MEEFGGAVGELTLCFVGFSVFMCSKGKSTYPLQKRITKKGKDEAAREQGLKRLHVNPDQISQKMDLSTICLLSILFSGQEQCLWGKPIELKGGEISQSLCIFT